ncbi:MAG: nuclear transport factor 2 family protein [Chlamydiota bacterium]|nr:nuclear transport factor 2 family protein [Chlamydiota bacterium]
MRKCFTSLLLSIATIPSLIVGHPDTNHPKDDEYAIHENIINYVKAFQNQDAQTLASFWATDATYTNPETGYSIEGRDAIENEFSKMFKDESPSKLELTVESIEFLNDDRAIEKGSTRILNGKEPITSSKYVATHIKKNGKWLIQKMAERPSKDNTKLNKQMNQLSWLVGNWIDHDENVHIETSCQWVLNNNFLRSNFKVLYHDQKELEGTQIIRFDPSTQQIRSEIYDSDGGYGEGIWSYQDNKWTVDITSTLPDGTKASSVVVYSPIDKDSYKIYIKGREVNGRILPNLEEASITRKRSN